MNRIKSILLAIGISFVTAFSSAAFAEDTLVGTITVDTNTASAASGCSWSNWAYMTMGKQRTLSCDGGVVAYAFFNMSSNTCSLWSEDSNTHRTTLSGCLGRVYEKQQEQVVTVYPGTECNWVSDGSYYGYNYFNFNCGSYGDVARKTVGFPWSYSSSGYSCTISANSPNIVESWTNSGGTDCDVTEVTRPQ